MHNAGYQTNNLPRRHPHPSAPPLTACFGGWESLLLFHRHFFPKSLPPLLSRRPHHPFVPLFSSSSLSAPNSTTLLSDTAGAANGTVLPRLIATLVLRDWCWSPRASSSCGDESLTSRWTSHIVCMPSSVPSISALFPTHCRSLGWSIFSSFWVQMQAIPHTLLSTQPSTSLVIVVHVFCTDVIAYSVWSCKSSCRQCKLCSCVRGRSAHVASFWTDIPQLCGCNLGTDKHGLSI